MGKKKSTEKVLSIISACPTPETGCFASDPDALLETLFLDDSVALESLERVINASALAGLYGKPLEDTTYRPAFLLENADAQSGRLGSKPRRGVLEVDGQAGSDMNQLRVRVAKCAHACGATALGCPIKPDNFS